MLSVVCNVPVIGLAPSEIDNYLLQISCIWRCTHAEYQHRYCTVLRCLLWFALPWDHLIYFMCNISEGFFLITVYCHLTHSSWSTVLSGVLILIIWTAIRHWYVEYFSGINTRFTWNEVTSTHPRQYNIHRYCTLVVLGNELGRI